MKLKYISSEQDRMIVRMIGENLSDKYIKLNSQELAILKQAQHICETAHDKLAEYHEEPDMQTDYGWADIYLTNIIGDQ